MKHKSSEVQVFMTDDYKVFRMINGNRPLNKKKIEKIISEIKEGNDVLNECPILVTESNGSLEVKDGQHRFHVAKQLKRAVHYIVKKQDMSLYNIAKMNTNTDKWKAEDYINCYVAAGDDHYKKLKEFHKKYDISIGSCLTLLTYGIQKHDGTIAELYAQFQQGIFKIKTWKEAVQFMELCKSFSTYKYWSSRGFLIAMTKIVTKGTCQMDVLVKKFNDNPQMISYSPDWKKIVANLEDIYNKGNSKRRTIF